MLQQVKAGQDSYRERGLAMAPDEELSHHSMHGKAIPSDLRLFWEIVPVLGQKEHLRQGVGSLPVVWHPITGLSSAQPCIRVNGLRFQNEKDSDESSMMESIAGSTHDCILCS